MAHCPCGRVCILPPPGLPGAVSAFVSVARERERVALAGDPALDALGIAGSPEHGGAVFKFLKDSLQGSKETFE